MDNRTCQTCEYFHQHYSLKTGKIVRVFYGHCTFSGTKAKRPFQKACAHYALGTPDEEAFANKKYLTKEMIKRLFEMEVLPSIDDA